MTQRELVYEDATDTAKKVRKALKAAFPESKFSVTSSKYSMGSSVRVNWIGGKEPDHDRAYQLTRRFGSKTFDGMNDYAETNGYLHEGVMYNGADYVIYSRS